MAVPTVVSKAIEADGLTLTVVWSEPVNMLDGEVLLNHPAGMTVSYFDGEGTDTFQYTAPSPIYAGETVTVDIDAGDVRSVSTGDENLAVAQAAVTNNSAVLAPGGPMNALNGGDRRSRSELTRLIGRR